MVGVAVTANHHTTHLIASILRESVLVYACAGTVTYHIVPRETRPRETVAQRLKRTNSWCYSSVTI